MDMLDSGIFTESSTDWIHRNHKLRIIVFYSDKVAKFPFDSVIGSEEIRHLNVNTFGCLCCNEVYLSGTKNAD